MSKSCCSGSVSLPIESCRIGTLEALYRMISGGCVPGGMMPQRPSARSPSPAPRPPRSWRPAGSRRWITPTPLSDWLSMCSMSLTVVVRNPLELPRRSALSISSATCPVYCQTTEMTGMSTSGKMSVGIRRMATTPRSAISIAITTNVYGRRSASRTIHIPQPCKAVPLGDSISMAPTFLSVPGSGIPGQSHP